MKFISIFFVFQMRDIYKSLFLVAHLIEALLPLYTQTRCHMMTIEIIAKVK